MILFLSIKLKKYLEFFSSCSFQAPGISHFYPQIFTISKAAEFSWEGLFWKIENASWSCCFNICSVFSLHLLIEYFLVYFLILCLTQSHTDRGSLRSFFPFCTQVSIKEFIFSKCSSWLSKEQLRFQTLKPLALLSS